MRTALRKMGNSTGMIVPKSLLAELGAGAGTAMDVRVEDGRLIATTAVVTIRAGWAEDAARVGQDEITDAERDWMGFGNTDDDALSW
jgi:antitoxin MazE